MRLHQLRLRNVKGVEERTIDFPETGVVVIEGPNEVGKSTLLEAFDLLLHPRYRSTSQAKAVRTLQPVGKDVAPYVEAEFSLGRYRLRFAKQWLRDPATTLEVLAPSPAQLTGTQAQERLDAILEESLDRPLWDAMRFVQAGELGQLPLTGSSVLTQALDAASGTDQQVSEGTVLLDQVRDHYLRFFTPTGRVTGELREAVTQVQLARDEAAQAHGRLVETEQLVQRHASLRDTQDQLTQARPELLADREAATSRLADVEQVALAYDKANEALRQARERSVNAARQRKARAALVREVTDDSTAATAAGTAVETAAAQWSRACAALQPVSDAAVATADELEVAHEVASRAASDAAHLADVEAAESLSARLETLASLQQDREPLLTPSAPSLGRSDLDALEAAVAELALDRARHQAASPSLTLEPLGDHPSVLVDGQALADPSVVHRRLVGGALTVEVPGQVRITLQPESGALARADRIEAGAAEVSRRLAAAGEDDLAGARAAYAEHQRITQELSRLDDRIATKLAGQTRELLARRLQDLHERVTDYLAERDPEAPLATEVEQARAIARAATVQVQTAKRRATTAREQLDAFRAQARLAEQAHDRAVTDQAVARESLRRVTARLEQGRAERSDTDVDEIARQRAREFAQVEAVEDTARRDLQAADVDGVRAAVKQAATQLADHDDRAAAVREDLLVLQGQVEQTSSEGRQEVYDRAFNSYLEARQRLDRVERSARAARQLHLTLQRHRDNAHRAYVRPYAAQIERLGREVYGQSFAVEVAEDLTICSRRLDGTTVPFEQLSGGAKEQLGILARLAVAALVDAEHGVPVIIDDALGYTDPERLRRVGSVFTGPAEQTQVVLLTCTPDRYAGIPGANTIRLTDHAAAG